MPRVLLRLQACASHRVWQKGAPWMLSCPPHLMPKFSVQLPCPGCSTLSAYPEGRGAHNHSSHYLHLSMALTASNFLAQIPCVG